jgi:diguanylate cyclase (GGDEF)-like protein
LPISLLEFMSARTASTDTTDAAGDETSPGRSRVLPLWKAATEHVNVIWWLNVAVTAAALGLFLGPISDLSALADPQIPWWVLAPAFLVAERCVVHLEFRRSAHSFSLGDLPLVFGLLFATGQDLIIGSLIGTAFVLVLDRRLPPIKLVFNLAQFSLAASLAAMIVHATAPVHGASGPDLWLATFASTEAAAVVAVLLICLAISLSEGVIRPRTLVQMLAMDLVVTVTNTSLALAGVTILLTDARAFPLLIVPVVTVFLAYRAYLLERQRHERLEFLYETTRTLSRSPEVVVALEGLLARSLEAFRAELAEIVLFGSDGNPPLRTTLGPGDHIEVMEPMDENMAREFLALVSPDSPVARLSRPFRSEQLRRYLDARRVTEGMVAMLPGEKRVIGTIMLANRFGVIRSFSDDDVRLFETLANNASVALQYDRLEQAVLQLRELQEQLEHQAFHDPLTNLANRSLFTNQVKDALAQGSSQLGILFIDVDDFKTVNDGLGHAAGDKLLVSVANRLQKCVRPSDVVARLGGDEFAVMLEDSEDAQDAALMVSERIMWAFDRPLSIGDGTVSVHVSVGISTTEKSGRRADEVIRDADVAMYQAKAAGKHRYQLFDPPMRSAVLRRHGLKEELRKAIERKQLVVEYQPIFALDTGEAVAAEALVRWQHPERGRLRPAEFVPLAEETNLIIDVGQVVLDEACRQARKWKEATTERPVAIHVNLSAVELREESLIDRVVTSVERAGVEPGQLVLELTESVVVEDAERSTAKLEALRKVGVRLALDDFGTGYSSLSYLRLLPLDLLKIATPFVQGITREQRESSFVRMMIELARTLGLQVVAEGIESAEELEALRELQCDFGQGFYLGPPIDLKEGSFPLPTWNRTPHVAEADAQPSAGEVEERIPLPHDVWH